MRPIPSHLTTTPAAAGAAGAAAAAAEAAAAPAGAGIVSSLPSKGSLSISVNWGIRLQQQADLLCLLQQIAAEGEKRLKASCLYTAKISAKASSKP